MPRASRREFLPPPIHTTSAITSPPSGCTEKLKSFEGAFRPVIAPEIVGAPAVQRHITINRTASGSAGRWQGLAAMGKRGYRGRERGGTAICGAMDRATGITFDHSTTFNPRKTPYKSALLRPRQMITMTTSLVMIIRNLRAANWHGRARCCPHPSHHRSTPPPAFLTSRRG